MNDTPYPDYLIDSDRLDFINSMNSIDEHREYLGQLLSWWFPPSYVMDYLEESAPNVPEFSPEEIEPQRLNWMKQGY